MKALGLAFIGGPVALAVFMSLGPRSVLGQAPSMTPAAAAALARATFEATASVLTVYDRRGNVVGTVGEPGFYSQPAFSPDGTRVAVVRRIDPAQNADIWVFDVATGASTRITSDQAGHFSPVWSPDGRQIAYGSGGAVYRKAASGIGTAELVYQDELLLRGPDRPTQPTITDWSPDGRTLTYFGRRSLYVLPLDAPGPSERKAIEVVSGQGRAGGGRFSPDGRFLAYWSEESGRSDIWIRPLDASGRVTSDGPWQISNEGGLDIIAWRQDGREIYYLAPDGDVMAVELDGAMPLRSGPPRVLFRAPDSVIENPANARHPHLELAIGATTARRDGQRFLFNTRPKRRGWPFPRQLTVFDRQGNVVRTLGQPDAYTQPMLSPDGTRVAAFLHQDIHVFDLRSGNRVQVTFSAGTARYQSSPVWSPDGRHIAFFSFRQDWGGLYRTASDGTGGEELLYRHQLGVDVPLTDWSADGRFLAFSAGEVAWAVPVVNTRASTEGPGQRAMELLREEFSVWGARFSPDGRYVAYASNESGRHEVHVRRFDATAGLGPETWQVSRLGGLGLIQWRQDGRELYYLAADGGVMAVEVTTTPTFGAKAPTLLFRAPGTFELESSDLEEGGTNTLSCSCATGGCEQGSISRNGERFVFGVPMPPERQEITVSAETLMKYVGAYDMDGQEWVVSLEGGTLMIQGGLGKKVPLFAESETRFFLKATNLDLEFVTNNERDRPFLLIYQFGTPELAIRR